MSRFCTNTNVLNVVNVLMTRYSCSNYDSYITNS